jgi:hypothetical protein
VVLAGDVGKALRTILASQNLITHAINYSQLLVNFVSSARLDCIVPGALAAEVENHAEHGA